MGPKDSRSRPKHVAKYRLNVIIASCLMYVVYWRCIMYYTDLIIHNGMAFFSLSKKKYLYWPMLTTSLHKGYMYCCVLVDRTSPNIALKNASNTLWKENGLKKAEGAVFPVHILEARGAGRVAPPILNLGARWRRVVSFTPRPPYTRERNRVSIEWKAYVISHTHTSVANLTVFQMDKQRWCCVYVVECLCLAGIGGISDKDRGYRVSGCW